MFNLINFLLSGILLLPLVYWEVPKVWSYLVFIDVFILLIIYMVNKNKLNLAFKNNKIVFFLIAFVLMSVVSSIFGSDLVKSIVGNFYRADGLVTLIHLVGFSIILGSFFKNEWNFQLALIIYLSSVASTIYNNFGQINFLVGFVLTSLPFGIYVFRSSKNIFLKAFLVVCFVLQLYLMPFANSYVWYLCLLIIFPTYFVLKDRKYIKYLIPVILAFSAVVIYLWYLEVETKTEYVAESRIRVYRNVLMGSLKKPIFGYGVANTDHVFSSIDWPMKFNDDVYVDKAHMLLLDIFANTGVLGIIIYLSFNYLIIKKLAKVNNEWSRTLILALVMHFIYAQTNITSISEEFIYWIIVGIVLSV